MPEPTLVSILTCPHCGHRSREVMPVDSCRFFHRCTACEALVKPAPGDCCVFCSYGNIPCPPVQQGRADCC